MHVALGWQYRDRRVQQAAVVYCAFEGQTGIQARVEAFRQSFPIETDEPVPFYLQPVTLDLVADHKELIAAVKRQLETTGPVLVVLDTLNRSLRGSENDSKDMAAYIAAADAIRAAFNCAVAIVHHCGIDGTRPRGSTALSGAVDAQLSVKRDAADAIQVEVEFQKDGAAGDIIASKLEPVDVGTDVDGETISSCVIRPTEVQETQQAKPSRRLPDRAKLGLRALPRQS
jgi:RecA-family ATPase